MRNNDQRRGFTPRGFTLVEMLVVIGIIAVLAGLLLPMLVRSLRVASRARTAADLNAISLALEAYKTDFGDYPRPSPGQTGTGFALLGAALIGPGPMDVTKAAFTAQGPNYQAGTINISTGTFTAELVALKDTTVSPVAGTDWAVFPYADGFDGPGFRTVYDTKNNIIGKSSGPYLQPEKFKLQGQAILDRNGFPILYFPANPAKLNLSTTGGSVFYVASLSATGMPTKPVTIYNFDDNGPLAISRTPEPTPDLAHTLARMQVMLGAIANVNAGVLTAGQLNSSTDTAATTGPYLLWSVGADGMFGPRDDIVGMAGDRSQITKAINNCDDVTNFTFAK